MSTLEPVTDESTWAEDARELICLSSDSYLADFSFVWRDELSCWIATKQETGKLVFIYPAQSPFSESEVKKFVRAAFHTAAKQAPPQAPPSKFIIAIKNGIGTSLINLNSPAIRIETKSALLDNLVKLVFWRYRDEIHERVTAELSHSNLSLNDVYVPSRFYPRDAFQRQNIEEHLFEWLDTPGQRQLALLGEYGQGKSTAALMFTYHLLCDQQAKRIPILIELHGKSPVHLKPSDLFSQWVVGKYIDTKALMQLLRAGRLVIIFDGFDEIALNAKSRLEHFKSLWQFCYPQAKILFTGHTNFFLDDEEMKAALGISETTSDKPYCEVLRLASFNEQQIKESLRAHKPLVRRQISSLVQTNQRFCELISKPSLLRIVSTLWEREGLAQKVDQLNSAYIMNL